MKILMTTGLLAALLSVNLPLHADSLWKFNEVFSNGDGSVQYIEMTSATSGQGQLQALTLVSSSTDKTSTFTFDRDLSGAVAGSHLLLATPAFTEITGVTPDFTIPRGFIPVAGGSLDFANSTDSLTITRGAMPLNGLQAMNGNGEPVTGSPMNFSGLSATVAAQNWASFDEITGVLNLPMLEVPEAGLANVSFMVNLQSLRFTLRNDYYFYREGISAGEAPSQLMSIGLLYIPGVLVGNEILELVLSLVDDDPVVLGYPEILGITSASP
ncbi:MAG: hypothetical protein RLZZ385_1198 [Pseudomonadota bacterium]|jgi:hypothetical protein